MFCTPEKKRGFMRKKIVVAAAVTAAALGIAPAISSSGTVIVPSASAQTFSLNRISNVTVTVSQSKDPGAIAVTENSATDQAAATTDGGRVTISTKVSVFNLDAEKTYDLVARLIDLSADEKEVAVGSESIQLVAAADRTIELHELENEDLDPLLKAGHKYAVHLYLYQRTDNDIAAVDSDGSPVGSPTVADSKTSNTDSTYQIFVSDNEGTKVVADTDPATTTEETPWWDLPLTITMIVLMLAALAIPTLMQQQNFLR